METEQVDTPSTKPWFQSLTMWGVILTAISMFFKENPQMVSFLEDPELAELLATIGGGISLAIAAWGRMRASKGITR